MLFFVFELEPHFSRVMTFCALHHAAIASATSITFASKFNVVIFTQGRVANLSPFHAAKKASKM